MIRTKCQNMLRWSGQNANQKVGTDKMPTKKWGRTKCQPQKKIRTKCQPLVGIMSSWHFVRLAFWPTTALKRGSPTQQRLVKMIKIRNRVVWKFNISRGATIQVDRTTLRGTSADDYSDPKAPREKGILLQERVNFITFFMSARHDELGEPINSILAL